MKKNKFFPAVFIFLCFFASAQEEALDDDLDSLFDDAVDTTVEKTDTDHKDQFDQGQKFSAGGNFFASVGASIGADDNVDEFKRSYGMSVSANAFVDLRPTNYFRLYGKLETKVNPEKFDTGWGGIEIDKLYVDYGINDYIFLHLGNFPIRWGNGILFSPANLVSGIEDGFNMEISFPTLLDGINLIGYARIKDLEKMFSIKNFYFAGNADKVVKKVRFSLGAKYNSNDGMRTYFSTKAVFSHFEPYAELNYNFYDIGHKYFSSNWQVLCGTTFDIENFSLIAEYCYDATDDIVQNDHNLGLTIYYRKIFNLPINLLFNTQYTFSDKTGGSYLVLSYSAPRNAKISLGFPILWGKPNGRYTASLTKNQLIMDSFDSNTEFYQSLDKRFGCTILLSMSMNF